jgi:plastocyanin
MRLLLFLGTAALALGLIASGAWAVFQPITATDNTFGSPGIFTMDQGDRPTFANAGASQHNVTAKQKGPDGRALFLTPTLDGGQQATLDGTQYLTSGTYTFICTIHPTEMQATLMVSSNGTPQARPSATLKVRSKKIGKVSKKGIQVAITANTKIDGASLVAKLGGATLGKASGLSFASGQSVQTVKLTKSGKSKLRGKSKASVSVTADIPFGAPAKGKAKLS